MTDDEMRAMPIPTLQDEGLLFLWVTGRAMEVGRECMRVWGYTRVDEVVWVKTNQVYTLFLPREPNADLSYVTTRSYSASFVRGVQATGLITLKNTCW